MHKNNKPILLKNIRVIDASQNLDQEMNITVKNGIISYFENSKKNRFSVFANNSIKEVDCLVIEIMIFDYSVFTGKVAR